MRRFETILVAVDFSTHSQRALDEAIGLAQQEGARLHLVHAVELPAVPLVAYGFEVPTTYLSSAREAAQQLLEKAAKRAAERGVDAENHLCGAPADKGIVAVAAELRADLLVGGTHGHTGLKHLALGSVAERVLRRAPCSVLVVKERRDEAEARQPHGGPKETSER